MASGTDTGLKCGVCQIYTSFKEGDYFLTTQCGHVFHYECICEWICENKNCPLCNRTDINLESCIKLKDISPAIISCSSTLPNFKFVIVGDCGSGKSSLLLQYARGEFHHNTTATIGCDLKFKNLEVAGKTISLRLWDSGGEERYDSITPNYMRNAHGVFVVYDITKMATFDHLTKWLKLVKDYAPTDVSMMLIGNKTDLGHVREVPTEKGKDLASELGIHFLETSAKEAHNVEAAFRTLTATVLERLQQAGKLTDFVDVVIVKPEDEKPAGFCNYC